MIDALRRHIAEGIGDAFEALTGTRPEQVPVEDPPRPEVGDLACPVALQMAKRLGRNPRELGQQLAEYLNENPIPGVRDWTIAGPGFLNAWLDRGAALFGLVSGLASEVVASASHKVLVEHTSINPNKAAHIGHLRNACMGDTLARIFRHQGDTVEVHNYIDDTGVQVADVVIGFVDLRGMSAAEVAALPEPFDYYCWDLYTEVSARLSSDEALVERRHEVLQALEAFSGLEAEVAAVVVRRVVARHVATMRRLGIEYDLLVREGDILALDLWAEAFERLQSSEFVYHAQDGKHAGCWMMQLSGTSGFEELKEADKVLVRSNGVATYVAKDIAYHLWKYGLLERTFKYEPVQGLDAEGAGQPTVWQTTHSGGVDRDFGHADRAISVIDVRQSYLQSIVGRAFYLLGESEAGDSFTHFAYEMVALSPATARALGIPVAEDDDRQFVEMSGRRGYGVKADDLLDELERRAVCEVGERNPSLSTAERATIGRQIAVGAARYFLLRYTRKTVIVFDLDDALAFEGETGPYLQYAAVRARHIFDRLKEQTDVDPEALVEALASGGNGESFGATTDGVRARLASDDGQLWSLILALGRLDEVVEQAASSLEISVLAKYAFGLAQSFNRFYHSYPIVQAADADDRALRILVAHVFRQRLAIALEILGIPLPERM